MRQESVFIGIISFLNKFAKHLNQKTLYGAIRNRLIIYLRDLRNKIIYGSDAPVFAERIWVDPSQCRYIQEKYLLQTLNINHLEQASGRIIDNTLLFKRAISVFEKHQIKACIAHWVEGVTWEDTGIYEIIYNKVQNGEIIVNDYANVEYFIFNRYRILDNIFSETKNNGKIKTRKEVNQQVFRECGAPMVHIGPKGEPYYGGGGNHRFAIALILGLQLPARIGCVHKNAISFLPLYRKSKKT